jgi:hypothetical protein
VISGVEIIDASQARDNTYDGFRQEDYGNARVFALHVWSRSTATRFPRYALAVTGGQSELTNSHFESGKTANAFIQSVRTQMRGVSLYGARGGLNLHLRAGEVRFDGFLGPKVPGAPAVVGIKYGDGPGDHVAGTIIHADCADQDGGLADFTNSQGHNYLVARGILSSGTPYIGSPSANDTVDARFTGAATFGFYATPYATGINAAGTIQADATALSRFSRTHQVTSVAAGTGVRLWTPLGGEEALVFNAGANTLKIYPASGAQISLAGRDNAISVASGAGVYLRSVSATQWVSAP